VRQARVRAWTAIGIAAGAISLVLVWSGRTDRGEFGSRFRLPAREVDAPRLPRAPEAAPGASFDGAYGEVVNDVSQGEGLAHYALGAQLLQYGDYYGAASHLSVARDALGDSRRVSEMLAMTYDRLNMTLDLAGVMDCLAREAAHHESAARLYDRLSRHLDVEVEFHAAASDHFVASFPSRGPAPHAIGEILDVLERQRERISAELGLTSIRTVPVVVYEEDQLGRAMDVPHWARGLYDGKIRMALDGFFDRPAEFDAAIAHEYVHALTHELTGVRLPAWFREGLADNLARADAAQRERLAAEGARSAAVSNVDALRRNFVELSEGDASRAYQQSFAMVHNLVAEAGWAPVRDLLVAMQADPALGFEDAFVAVYGERPDGYVDRWIQIVSR